MLFDLQSRGRKTTIKAIYATLAVLMGGGLVFFGIGGEVSGGLFDAFNEDRGSASDADKAIERRIDRAERAIRARPKDPKPRAELARGHVVLSSTGDRLDLETGQYTEAGVAELVAADRAWQQHLKLAGDNPDDNLATLMAEAYAGGLGKFDEAVRAQEIVVEARPSAGTYEQLATYAWLAGQERKGDLAMQQALGETPRDQRPSLEKQLEDTKKQIEAQAQQQLQQQGAQPAPGG